MLILISELNRAQIIGVGVKTVQCGSSWLDPPNLREVTASFGHLLDPSPTASNFLRAAKTSNTLASGTSVGVDGMKRPIFEYLIETEWPIRVLVLSRCSGRSSILRTTLT